MKTIIIAEAGVNHNGDIEVAKKLIDSAADAGADYVKFQTFKAEKLVSKSAKKAIYQKKNIGDDDDSQFGMLKKLELLEETHFELQAYANRKGIKFLSTGFDEDSLAFLINEIGIDLIKIPSGELTNLPFLEFCAGKDLPIIISTGMANLIEVKEAVEVLISKGLTKKDVTVLHCCTQYPAPYNELNLNAITTLRNELDVNVGYSDHSLGIEVSIAAVALGATVIEKHFTLDRQMKGPDHAASLEPNELKAMVKAVRNIELALGSYEKIPSDCEIPNIAVARKSIHIRNGLSKGSIITQEDLIMTRPGDGISPMEYGKVIGKEVKNDLDEGVKLNWSDIC